MVESLARHHPETTFHQYYTESHRQPTPNQLNTNINQPQHQQSANQVEWEVNNQHLTSISNPNNNTTQPTTNAQSAAQSHKSRKTKSNLKNRCYETSNDSDFISDSDQRSFKVGEANIIKHTSPSQSELQWLRTYPTVAVTIPTSSRFAKARYYRYYRLNNMSYRFPASLTRKLSKYSKRLNAHMSMVSFTCCDSVSILSFH